MADTSVPSPLEGTEDDHIITKEEIATAAADFRSAMIDSDTLVLEDADGRKELLIFDGDRAMLKVIKDLTGLQEANKAAYNEPIDRRSEFRRIASLDVDFLAVYGFDHGLPQGWWGMKIYMPLLVRIAHDSDYRDFRTMPGYYIRKT